MKAFVSLAIAAVMATSGEAAISAKDLDTSEKASFCSAILSDSAYLKQASAVCDKYKYSLPRPRVYNACKTGLNAGAKEACAYAISDKGSTKKCARIKQPLQSKLQSTCAKSWRTAPRPTVGAACQEGFETVAFKMCDFVTYTLESYSNDEGAVDVEEALPEVVEEPVIEEPVAEEPVVEEPVVEEEVPEVVEEPVEKPVVAEEVPEVVEEVVVEEPAVEEPVAEETAAELLSEEDADAEDAVERLTQLLDEDEQ